MQLLSAFLTQIVSTFGVVVFFGLFIALARRLFCKLMGPSGPKILLWTGIVGTPVHELSHAFMCVIFGHKITEIKLYSPHSREGVLGYVHHSYNPRNIYHRIGNFFIGTAPIIGGSAVLCLIMRLTVPDIFGSVFRELSGLGIDFSSVSDAFFSILSPVLKALRIIFSPSGAANIMWWLFIVLSLLISTHMEVSISDIKSGFSGFFAISLIIFSMDFILYIVNKSLLMKVTAMIVGFSSVITAFLAISFVFSLILILIALTVNIVKRIIG